MRISCFFVLAAAAAGVVASGNALATVDSTKMTPAHAIKAVQSDGDPTKRLLRVVERDDEEYDDSKEERTNFNWSTLKSLFPGTARRAANEESKMSTLASKFAVYKSDDWMPLDVYTLMRKTMSHQKAMKYGLRYEKIPRERSLVEFVSFGGADFKSKSSGPSKISNKQNTDS